MKNYFDRLCYLVYRRVVQDSSSLGFITLKETFLMFEMLDFMLDLTKRYQYYSFMSLVGNIFKLFVEPTLIDSRIKIHLLTNIKKLILYF